MGVRVAGLIIVDAIILNLTSFLSLWIRFDCIWSRIPVKYLSRLIAYAPVYTVITFLIFTLFRLYRTLWEYASVYELMLLGLAVITNTVLQYIGMGQ